VVLAILYPSTSPQTKQTVSLVNHLRDNLIPQTEKCSSLAVHIGGVTATDIDFSRVLTEKLPLFIAVVVFLAFLLLTGDRAACLSGRFRKSEGGAGDPGTTAFSARACRRTDSS
jgi:uncharacterized membrane protein YdfJ with MMPL/SSD domain